MSLIEDHHRVGGEVRLAQELAQQHAVGHVLEHRALGGAVLEADRVADLVAELAPHLVGDALRDGHGSDAAWLRAADLHTAVGEPGLVKVLRDLRRLARARLADDDEALVLAHRLDNLLAVRIDGQRLAYLLHRCLLGDLGRGRRLAALVDVACDELVLDEVDLLLLRHHQLVRRGARADLPAALSIGSAHLCGRPLDLRRVPRLKLVQLLRLLLLVPRHHWLEALRLVDGVGGVIRLGHVVALHLIGDRDALLGVAVQLLLELHLLALLRRQRHVAEEELLVDDVVARLGQLLLLALLEVLAPRGGAQLAHELGLLVAVPRAHQLALCHTPSLQRERVRVVVRELTRALGVARPHPLHQRVALLDVSLPLRLDRILTAISLHSSARPRALLLCALLRALFRLALCRALLRERALHRRLRVVLLVVVVAVNHCVLLALLTQRRLRLHASRRLPPLAAATATLSTTRRRPGEELRGEGLCALGGGHVSSVQLGEQAAERALGRRERCDVVGEVGLGESDEGVELVAHPRLERHGALARRSLVVYPKNA
mmetsp:Transcript_3805/g.8624  ORF Transcript_3805/g.8624 Transcript_3805/m.8624 type:complete len:547 (+) Transcript_3805:1499-3139(+)